jgi:hypothetical protein
MSSVWSTTPTLKKCFKDENHALEVFEKELKANLPELQKHGLFFSFTTDPMLPETITLTWKAVSICFQNNVPVKILTKRTDFLKSIININRGYLGGNILFIEKEKKLIALGFTLTGHDELEPNTSTNAERIEAIRKLHDAGFKTWASIEPIIDFESSFDMIDKSWDSCDLFKIGLQSGKKYDKKELNAFVNRLLLYRVGRGRRGLSPTCHVACLYFKDSLLKQAGISRPELPDNCVGRDYNVFNV